MRRERAPSFSLHINLGTIQLFLKRYPPRATP
jgi:hypothetical protein